MKQRDLALTLVAALSSAACRTLETQNAATVKMTQSDPNSPALDLKRVRGAENIRGILSGRRLSPPDGAFGTKHSFDVSAIYVQELPESAIHGRWDATDAEVCFQFHSPETRRCRQVYIGQDDRRITLGDFLEARVYVVSRFTL